MCAGMLQLCIVVRIPLLGAMQLQCMLCAYYGYEEV